MPRTSTGRETKAISRFAREYLVDWSDSLVLRSNGDFRRRMLIAQLRQISSATGRSISLLKHYRSQSSPLSPASSRDLIYRCVVLAQDLAGALQRCSPASVKIT